MIETENEEIYLEAKRDFDENKSVDRQRMDGKVGMELKELSDPVDIIEETEDPLMLQDNSQVAWTEDDRLYGSQSDNISNLDLTLDKHVVYDESRVTTIIEELQGKSSKDTVQVVAATTAKKIPSEPHPVVVETEDNTAVVEEEEAETSHPDKLVAAKATALLKVSNPEAKWADNMAQISPTKVHLKRNIVRKRNLSKQVTFFPPDYNIAMEAIWTEIYISHTMNTSAITKNVISSMMKKYAAIQLDDAKKTDSEGKDASTGLMAVGSQQAEVWTKKQNDIRQSPLKKGRFSRETIEINDDVRKVLLADISVQPPTVMAANLQIHARSATIVEEPQGTGKRVAQPKPSTCPKCKVTIGNEQGIHSKGNCPLKTEDEKAAEAEKKNKKLKLKQAFDDELKQRRVKADKRTDELGKKCQKRKYKLNTASGEKKCNVCYLCYNSSLTDKEEMWHFVRSKRVIYCPMADDDSVKIKLILESKQKVSVKNRKNYQRSSKSKK